jgi:hypothetical protein
MAIETGEGTRPDEDNRPQVPKGRSLAEGDDNEGISALRGSRDERPEITEVHETLHPRGDIFTGIGKLNRVVNTARTAARVMDDIVEGPQKPQK